MGDRGRREEEEEEEEEEGEEENGEEMNATTSQTLEKPGSGLSQTHTLLGSVPILTPFPSI